MKKLIVVFLFSPLFVIGQHHMMHVLSNVTTLQQDLVSVWELDETSGTTAFDSYDSNDGSNSNATINQTGKVYKAYSFNSSSSIVAVPYNSTFNNSGYVTISAWVKMPASVDASYRRILSTQGEIATSGNTTVICIRKTNLKKAQALFRSTGNVLTTSTGTTTLLANTWYHIVAVLTPTSATIYVNGTNENSVSVSGGNFTPSEKFTIGALTIGSTVSEYWSGLIDQSVWWNRALTQNEITKLYNSGNGIVYVNW